jgi:hypothetical protein
MADEQTDKYLDIIAVTVTIVIETQMFKCINNKARTVTRSR